MIAIVVFIISFGLMSVSVAIRDKKSTPPLIQQFGNDVAGAVDRVIAWPVNGLQSATNSVSDLLDQWWCLIEESFRSDCGRNQSTGFHR
ncbi:hypothetical protein WP50_32480 [Lactiplantibacillus plantarum]|nr:hypothetical protein WP50_32480 [Lactiplantibacillus plantarum]